MTPQAIVALVGVSLTFLGTLIGCTWYLGSKAGTMDAKLELLLTNHLPHIDKRLERLESVLIERASN